MTGQGQSGCTLALLAEILVPWGFLLYFLRAAGNTGSLLFKSVWVGGMVTLTLRSLLWGYIIIIHDTYNFSAMPLAFSIFINVVLLVGFYLEITWFRLYLRNFRRSSQQMGK